MRPIPPPCHPSGAERVVPSAAATSHLPPAPQSRRRQSRPLEARAACKDGGGGAVFLSSLPSGGSDRGAQEDPAVVVPRRVGAPGFGISALGSGCHGGGSGRGGAAAVRGDAMAAACCSGAEEVAAMVKARVGSGWPAVVRPRLALFAGVGWPKATPVWLDPGPLRLNLASAMPVPSPGVVAAAAHALPAGACAMSASGR